ncbi:hypothetical protein HDU90_006705 [Geranomyces variabilis]|nr:hypothetical protein HDU90_006705 [Geranomyces variabilis]
MTRKQQKQAPYLVVLSVGFYMATSIVMLSANKMVLLKVALPVTFLWVQMLIAVFWMHVGHALGCFVLPQARVETAKKLWALITINVLGLTLNTYTIQYGDASFYQVALALSGTARNLKIFFS